MELSDLKTEMDEQFRHVRDQFKNVDEQFKQVHERFAEVDQRFAQVDQRFAQVDQRFAQVDQRFAQVDQQFTELRQAIAAEGDKTRRHFDMVAEQMKAERNLALDAIMAADGRLARMSASNATDHAGFEARLLDHERRLTTLEGA